MFPKHLHYVETHFGGGAVLLARDPDDPQFFWGNNGSTRGVSEVANDIDCQLANFWRVLGNAELFPEFNRRVNEIPLGRQFWQEAHDYMTDDGGVTGSPVDYAVAFFVECRQSHSGRRKDFTCLTRNRTRRQMNGNVSEWLGAVDGLPEVHARLRRVVVENMDAVKLIRRDDEVSTFFYCDPPYHHSTRASKDAYAHEMTEEQHVELLETLGGIKGKFILSGYRCELYDQAAERFGWKREDIDIANHAAGGENKRRMVESLWRNYD